MKHHLQKKYTKIVNISRVMAVLLMRVGRDDVISSFSIEITELKTKIRRHQVDV